MGERVNEINLLKATLDNVTTSAQSRFDEVIRDYFKVFAEAARGDMEADLGCDAAVSESWFLRSYAPNSPVASSPAAPLPRPALPTSLPNVV